MLLGVDVHLGTGGTVRLKEAEGGLDRLRLAAEEWKIGSLSREYSLRSDTLMEVSKSSLDNGGEDL